MAKHEEDITSRDLESWERVEKRLLGERQTATPDPKPFHIDPELDVYAADKVLLEEVKKEIPIVKATERQKADE